MPETTPLIKAALNLRVGAGFDVYLYAIDQKQRNNSKDAQIYYPSIQNNVLLPL